MERIVKKVKPGQVLTVSFKIVYVMIMVLLDELSLCPVVSSGCQPSSDFI
jgi:hypothetical protein